VSIENAAKEGAFYGSRNPLCDVPKAGCANPNTVDWRVRNELPGVTINGPSIDCLDPAAGTVEALSACVEDDLYRVGVSHQFALLTPLLSPILGGTLTLSSTATAVVLNEAFDPNATPFPMPTDGNPPPPPPPPPGGCSSTPAANFAWSQQNRNRPVEFEDTSSTAAGCTITAWAWDFGDGTTSTDSGPSHAFPLQATAYSVSLTVTNTFGSNTITQTVTTK